MTIPGAGKIGYVVKRYPRYSETFIVNEILAHESAGMAVEVFALLPPTDTHFQEAISRVRAPVNYLPGEGSKVAGFWRMVVEASKVLPGFWGVLEQARDEPVRDLVQAMVLARQVRERGITHLHAHFATSAAAVARWAARFSGVRYSFTAHAKDIFHEDVHSEELGRKVEGASAVVTVSDYNARYLQERYPAAAGRVVRIYNGLPLEEFRFVPPRERPARIVAVGRLVEKKGVGDLVSACAVLLGRGCEFGCLIVGAGEEEGSLREQIRRLGLGERVTLAGPLPQPEVIRAVQSAAVLAAPCVIGADGNRDGLPTVLLEAMALGTPCVATDVTGIPEVIRAEETGLMVGQRDPEALAGALERLLRDGSLRLRLAEAARRLVESEFDSRKNSLRLRELFERSRAGNGEGI